MKTLFKLTMKSALRDPFLLFWSILLPIGGLIGLGNFIKSPNYPSTILTGMMGTSILFYSLVTTAFSILMHRRRGVYNLLRVTPMTLWKYVLSIAYAWTLISIICGSIVLTVGVIMFDIKISLVSILMLYLVTIIATIGYVLLSFFIASLSKNEGQMSTISNLFILPLLFCSNAFYSLNNAPAWLEKISQFNPFQWFINGLRSSLALDFTNCLLNMALLLIVVVVAMFLAVRTFRFADK